MDKINVLPATLEEAIELLKSFYGQHLDKIKAMSEREFLASSHFMSGMFIRNSWNLWWYAGHPYEDKGWSKDQPKLNKWFESIGITHADDMSGILLTCLHRHLSGVDYNLDEQVAKYQAHWKKHGYPDGIPRHG